MARGIYKHPKGAASNHFKHGLHGTRIYRIYTNMKTRCYNPNYIRYKDWGGRGIKVCNEWLTDFKAFYDWAILNGYNDKLTLDRIDANGNYEPSNCRWVDYHTQAVNKRTTRVYEYNGVKFNQCDVYKLFGVKRTTFNARLGRGLTVKQAIEG